MTNPESITVSLEWAKKLIVEAGWRHKTCFVIDIFSEEVWFRGDENRPDSRKLVAAPTAEEILRRLPPLLSTEHTKGWLKMCAFRDGFSVGYDTFEAKGEGEWANYFKEATLANAAAAMYAYLSESGLLPVS